MNSGRFSVEICPVRVRNCRPASHSSGFRSTSRAKACTCLTNAVMISRSRGSDALANASTTSCVSRSWLYSDISCLLDRLPGGLRIPARGRSLGLHDKAEEVTFSDRYDRRHRFDSRVSMELRHLRYFVAVAEHLSFTRAAARVHVTQSTLSHQIRQLEDELGHVLFDRIGKRVMLTEAGETFLGYASRALREV